MLIRDSNVDTLGEVLSHTSNKDNVTLGGKIKGWVLFSNISKFLRSHKKLNHSSSYNVD